MEREDSNVGNNETQRRRKRRQLQSIFYALTYQVHAFERILTAKNIANPRSRGNGNALTLFMKMIQMIVLHQIPARRGNGATTTANARSNSYYARPSRRTVEDLEKIVEEVRNLIEMFEPAKNDRRNPTLSLFIQIITFILQEKQGGQNVNFDGGLNTPWTERGNNPAKNQSQIQNQVATETETVQENRDKSREIEEIRSISVSPLTPSPTSEKLLFTESSTSSTPEIPKEIPKESEKERERERECETETETEPEAERETAVKSTKEIQTSTHKREDTPLPSEDEKKPQRPTRRVKIEPRASKSSTDESSGFVYGEELIPKKKYDRENLLQIREWCFGMTPSFGPLANPNRRRRAPYLKRIYC